MRQAWPGAHGFACSYCGRRLGIRAGSIEPGAMINVDHGWLLRDGRLEYRKPAHKGAAAGAVVLGVTAVPLIALCRNRACAELVEIA